MVVPSLAWSPFEGCVQLGWDLVFRHAKTLEVTWIAGGSPQLHDVAGIDRQDRLEGCVKEAAMDRCRRGLQLVDLLLGLRRSRAHDDYAAAEEHSRRLTRPYEPCHPCLP